jgi:uncharacterized protein YukE
MDSPEVDLVTAPGLTTVTGRVPTTAQTPVVTPLSDSKATIDDLLAAAAKLDALANEMEHTGQKIGGSAAAALAANFGFKMAIESHATVAHLNTTIAHTVRDMRAHARELKTTAAKYQEQGRLDRIQMAVSTGNPPPA